MSETSKTVDKALLILRDLAENGPATPQRLSVRLGVNRTVTQRLLTTLASRGFVSRAEGEYALASRVRSLSLGVFSDLRSAARFQMDRLRELTGETTVLQVLDGDVAIVISETVPQLGVAVTARHEVGARSRLTQTASGIAIIAALEPHEIERLLRASVIDAADQERISQAQRAGVAISSNELQQGVSGIAAPIRHFDTVASLALIAPTERGEKLESRVEALLQSTAAIQRLLAAKTP